MNELCQDSPTLLRKHLNDLLKDINDPSGIPINAATIFDDLLPAFLDTNRSEQANDPAVLTISSHRDTGWLALGQSLQKYTLQQYGSLGTTFLERILLQAQAALPFAKLAPCFGMDKQLYDAPYEASDRLCILLGALHSHFGTTAVNSLLHPQFKQHIFIGKAFRAPEANNVTQFENILVSRGGSIDFDHVQVEASWPLRVTGWNCSVTYQLGRGTPYILHQRQGQSKKQAKSRVLHDIYNYYARNNLTLMLHCNTSVDHPHFKIEPNINQVDPTVLSIPLDQLYDYDETQTPQDLEPKPHNPNIIFIPSDTNTTSHDKEISFLARALLFDFDLDQALLPDNNNTPGESPSITDKETSPPSKPSLAIDKETPPSKPSLIIDKETPPPPLKPSLIINKETTPLASPPSKPFLTMNKETTSTSDPPLCGLPLIRNEELTPIPSSRTLLGTQQVDLQTTDKSGVQGQSTEEGRHAQKNTAIDLILPMPLTDEELLDTAQKLMAELTIKEREKLYLYDQQHKLIPGNSKGHLINLAGKFDGWYYDSAVDHLQLAKSRAYYKATVHFGSDANKIVMVRTSSKKNDAECQAALAIFELCESAAKQLNELYALQY